jgi:hypothetical protein
LKGLATCPFGDCVKDAVDVINWIRGRPRIHALVFAATKKTVFRVIEIRFATHVIALTRLLEIKMAVAGLSVSDDYDSYKDGLDARGRLECERMEVIVENKMFWAAIKTFCTVSTPAVEALRLLDRSACRTKDVNQIWAAVGNRLGTLLNDPALVCTPAKRLDVFQLYLKHRAKHHRPAFDAAEVLNPANLPQIRRFSTQLASLDERTEWTRMRKNTLKVLEITVRRKVLVDLRVKKQDARKRQRIAEAAPDDVRPAEDPRTPPPVSGAEFEVEFEKLWTLVQKEFRDYYAGEGIYAEVKLGSEDEWVTTDGALRFFAVRILNMACTISDVERLHKVYSGVHTPARNRLSNGRVDELSMARLVLRIRETERMTKHRRIEDDDIRYFATLTLDKAMAALHAWGVVLSDALVAVARAINQPSDTFEMRSSGVSQILLSPQQQAPDSGELEVEDDDVIVGDNEVVEDYEDDGVERELEESLGLPPALAEFASSSDLGDDAGVILNPPLFFPLFS